MRLAFAGTPPVAVPALRALATTDHELSSVITRVDAPQGRRRVLTPSPVAIAAEELGLRVHKASRLDAAVTERIAHEAPDLGVIVAYGGLVREPLLSLPKHGWINLHFSLLPKWRGAAPVQRALMAGDTVTGASVFRLVAELDAGPVFADEEYEIPEGATAGQVLDALAERGGPLLTRVIDMIADGTARAREQVGEPSFAPKLGLADGAVDWSTDAAVVLARIRGVTPEPGAHTTVDGARVKILSARPAAEPHLAPGRLAASGRAVLVGTATEAVELVTVQPAGKPAMAAGDWWRGLRLDDPMAGS